MFDKLQFYLVHTPSETSSAQTNVPVTQFSCTKSEIARAAFVGS
jgi:hypothetical protein